MKFTGNSAVKLCHTRSGNSLDKFHHTRSVTPILGGGVYPDCYPRSVAYLVELVLLNKHQISGDIACLHCYQKFVPVIKIYSRNTEIRLKLKSKSVSHI